MIEQFHGAPAAQATASFGTTITWDEAKGGMGLVPVVGIRTTSYQVITLSDPALIRNLIDELSVALHTLEAASRG